MFPLQIFSASFYIQYNIVEDNKHSFEVTPYNYKKCLSPCTVIQQIAMHIQCCSKPVRLSFIYEHNRRYFEKRLILFAHAIKVNMIQNNNNANDEGMTELPLQDTQIKCVHLFWLSGSEIRKWNLKQETTKQKKNT